MEFNITYFFLGCALVGTVNVLTEVVRPWLWSKGQERSFKYELYFITIMFILLQIYANPFFIILEK